MSCNAEEASCMEVVGSGTLVLALLGSIPGTEQDSFERRERHARISPTRYRQFQLPIVIYEAVQLLTCLWGFLLQCTGVRPMGPLYAYPSGSQLYIPVLNSTFLEDPNPVTILGRCKEYVDLLIFQTAMELCFICSHID